MYVGQGGFLGQEVCEGAWFLAWQVPIFVLDHFPGESEPEEALCEEGQNLCSG